MLAPGITQSIVDFKSTICLHLISLQHVDVMGIGSKRVVFPDLQLIAFSSLFNALQVACREAITIFGCRATPKVDLPPASFAST